MLTYKNQLKELVLPEYGRNIQNMVEFCLTIEDRDERTRCARSIVDAMQILFPAQIEQQTYRRKLWDHLAIISDYRLDVDIPFELVTPDSFDEKPQAVSEGACNIRRRHYGHLVEAMVAKAAEMPEGEERYELIMMVANHMKKLQLALNPEGVDDYRIFKDLYEMTDGAINIDYTTNPLHDFKIAPVPGKKKRKK